MILLTKIFLSVCAFIFWILSQKLIHKRHQKISKLTNDIWDQIHEWTKALNARANQSLQFAKILLISSSLLIDLLGIAILFSAIFGPSIQPLLSLIILFTLRQLNQAVTMLPTPRGMVWFSPGVPSLFVTYEVSRDLFFSGHTALAVLACLELSQIYSSMLFNFILLMIALYEICTVLILRAHWTMDVFCGAITAFGVFEFSKFLAPAVDHWLQALFF